MRGRGKLAGGEWTYECHEIAGGTDHVVYDEYGQALAMYLTEDQARLIAAAPDMLAVCRMLDEAVKAGHDNVLDLTMHFLRAADFARAAIAKAEGRS